MADESKQQYSCYTPEWFYEKLSPSQNIFMFYLFKKMRLNRKIENIEFRMSDVKNMSRRSFFNAIDTLTLSRSCKERPYLLMSKIDKSTYCISLNKESGHYTEQDYEHLTRPFKNMLPDMTMQMAQKSAPQVEIKPLDISTVFGVQKTTEAIKEPLKLDNSKSDIKFKSDKQKDAYEKMWSGA